MPLYEYQCRCCNFKKEYLLSIKWAEEYRLCPVCGGWMQKLLGSIAHFIIKGGM